MLIGLIKGCVLPPGRLQEGLMGWKKRKMLCFLGFQTSIWHFSRFETFLKVAFDVRSAAWLAARWTDGIEKAEKVGKML